MAMLLKLIMAFGALLIGSILGGNIGWSIGKLFRKNED